MHIQALEAFRAVARHDSITGAAQALGYTQSAVSRQIAALEADTGTRLFDRVPRGVVLTEEGRCLLPHAEAVLERLATARRELDAIHGLGAGRLRIGAFPTAVASLVPRTMAAFRQTHPGVELLLVEGTTPRLLDRLLAGDVDVAVVSTAPDQPLDSTRFRLCHLLDEPLMVAVSRDHRLARRRTVRLADLAGESFIAGSNTPENTLLRTSVARGFQPRIDFVVAEWAGKFGCVAAGLGVTLVPGLAARSRPPDIALLRLHPDDAVVRHVFAATVAARTPPRAAAAFVDTLRELAQDI